MLKKVIIELPMVLLLIGNWQSETGIFADFLTSTDARPLNTKASKLNRLVMKAFGKNRDYPLSLKDFISYRNISSPSTIVHFKNNTLATKIRFLRNRRKLKRQIKSNLSSLDLLSKDNRDIQGRYSTKNLQGGYVFKIRNFQHPKPRTAHKRTSKSINEKESTRSTKNIILSQSRSAANMVKSKTLTRRKDNGIRIHNEIIHKDEKTAVAIQANNAQIMFQKYNRSVVTVDETKNDSEAKYNNSIMYNSSSHDQTMKTTGYRKIGNHSSYYDNNITMKQIIRKHWNDSKRIKHVNEKESNKDDFKLLQLIRQYLSQIAVKTKKKRLENIVNHFVQRKNWNSNKQRRQSRAAVDEAEDLAYLMQGDSATNKEKMEEMIASDFSTPENLDKDSITNPKGLFSNLYGDLGAKLSNLMKTLQFQEGDDALTRMSMKSPGTNGTKTASKKKSHKELHGLAFIEAEWGPWGDWSECTAHCHKGGFSMRRRTCDTLPDIPCEGNSIDVIDCKANGKCEASWQPWTDWGPCSVTCGEGVMARSRVCNTEDVLKTCKGKSNEFHNCKMEPCRLIDSDNATVVAGQPIPYGVRKYPTIPVAPALAGVVVAGAVQGKGRGPYQLSAWTRWSACSNSCGRGSKRRSRLCRDVTKSPPLRVHAKHCGGGLTLQDRPCTGNCKTKPVAAAFGAAGVGAGAAVVASGMDGQGAGVGMLEDYEVLQEDANMGGGGDGEKGMSEEEEEEEKEDEGYLTPETFIFIALVLLSVILFIAAFCICLGQKWHAARMKLEIRSLQPFYKSGEGGETQGPGGSGSKIRFRQVYNYDEYTEERDDDDDTFPTDAPERISHKDVQELLQRFTLASVRKEDGPPSEPPVEEISKTDIQDDFSIEEVQGDGEWIDLEHIQMQKEHAGKVPRDADAYSEPEVKSKPEEQEPIQIVTVGKKEPPDDKRPSETKPSPTKPPPSKPIAAAPAPPAPAASPLPLPEKEKPDAPPQSRVSKFSLLGLGLGRRISTAPPATPIVDMTVRELAEEMYKKIGIKGDVDSLIRSLESQRIRKATKQRKDLRDKVKIVGRRDANLRVLAKALKAREKAAATAAAAEQEADTSETNAPHQRRQKGRRSFPMVYPIHGVSRMSGTKLTFSSNRNRIRLCSKHKTKDRRSSSKTWKMDSSSSSSWLTTLLSETDKTLDGIDSEIEKSFKNLFESNEAKEEFSYTLQLDQRVKERRDVENSMEQRANDGFGEAVIVTADERKLAQEEWIDSSSDSNEISLNGRSSKVPTGAHQVVGKTNKMRASKNQRNFRGRSATMFKRLSEEDYNKKKNAVMSVMKKVVNENDKSATSSYDSSTLKDIFNKIEKSKCSVFSTEISDSAQWFSSRTRETHAFTENDVPTLGGALEETSETNENGCEEDKDMSPFAKIWNYELKRIVGTRQEDDECVHSVGKNDFRQYDSILSKNKGQLQEESSTSAPSPSSELFESQIPYDKLPVVYEDSSMGEDKEEENEYKKILAEQINAFAKSSSVRYPKHVDSSLKPLGQLTNTSELCPLLEKSPVDLKDYVAPNELQTSENIAKKTQISQSFLKSACEEMKKQLRPITAERTVDPRDKSTDFESLDTDCTESFMSICSDGSQWGSFATKCRDVDSKTSLYSAPLPEAVIENKLKINREGNDTIMFSRVDSPQPPYFQTTQTYSERSPHSLVSEKCLVNSYSLGTTPLICTSDDVSSENLWSCHSDQIGSVIDEPHALPFEDSLYSIQSFKTSESLDIDDLTSVGNVSPPNEVETLKQVSEKKSKTVSSPQGKTDSFPRDVDLPTPRSAVLFSLSNPIIEDTKNKLQFELQDGREMDTALSASTEILSYCEADNSQITQSSHWTGFQPNVANAFFTPPPPISTIASTSTATLQMPVTIATTSTATLQTPVAAARQDRNISVAFVPTQESNEYEKSERRRRSTPLSSLSFESSEEPNSTPGRPCSTIVSGESSEHSSSDDYINVDYFQLKHKNWSV